MPPLRLYEYQRCRVEWDSETRRAVLLAAESWRQAHRLPKAPLNFAGADGRLLCAEQYVGVVEAGGVRVEIYPKLDAELMRQPQIEESRARTVMSHLLWLLGESQYQRLIDAGDASVKEAPNSFPDLLAWLFARRLLRQLALGPPLSYVGHEDDLSLVRGRIHFPRQAARNFDRPDVIACRWDEFSADTALSRLLRAAAKVLLIRTRLAAAAAQLRDALAMLDDAAECHPHDALQGARSIRWSRLNHRWKPCHDLALAVLHGMGRQMRSGGTESFVYLLDMNDLFESYCRSWLERTFQAPVRPQQFLGTLLDRRIGGLQQQADFVWQARDRTLWIGDAKYKASAGGDWPKVADVRQLICYGQMARLRFGATRTELMLLYPTTTPDAEAEACLTYDGQRLTLQPVLLVKPAPAGARMKAI